MNLIHISLDSLDTGIPVVPSDAAGFYKQNCMVCLCDHGHSAGVALNVEIEGRTNRVGLTWTGEVDDQIQRSFSRNIRRAIEFGAEAITFLLLRDLTDYDAIEQSSLGTGFDYALSRRGRSSTYLFNDADAYIEITGIGTESSSNNEKHRRQEKLNRVKSLSRPLYISVVVFNDPRIRMTRHE